jgi:nitrate reductase gamma subunit
MTRETLKALGWAALITGILAVLIVVGSRNLTHFDAALVAYTFATLFAVGGITYRYALWLQRPPTALFWRRGWQVFVRPRHMARNLVTWVKRVIGEFALNNFIYSRNRTRWAAHWVLMWGCVLAVAITFPLVYGWLSFASTPDQLDRYRVIIFGFPTVTFPADSILGFLAFHGLDISAVLVIAGVMLAMRRRMRDEGASALQTFTEDFMPLILLFAVSLSGLMLTVSYTWMLALGFDFIKVFHATTVILTLAWLPFGKFFHIFQRPAQLGVEFYKDVAEHEEPAHCRRCGHAFASRMHIADLIQTERELGYRYEVSRDDVEHYQWLCPRCRRAMIALAQGRLKTGGAPVPAPLPAPMPTYANPSLGQGPLSLEDQNNYHP